MVTVEGVRYTTAILAAVVVAIFAAAVFGSPAQTQTSYERTAVDVVGASISHPKEWTVERDDATYDGTYGFVLWDTPQVDNSHGGMPRIRIARAPALETSQIEQTAEERVAGYPDLTVQSEKVSVGENSIEGTAVGPIPGATPSTEIYVPVNGRVYQINVYGEGLGEKGRELLSGIKFYEPSRSVESLGLEEAAEEPDPGLIQQLESGANSEEPLFSAQGTSGERKISEGCWRADPNYYFQTQHAGDANAQSGDGIRTGWTVVGRPNYWGQYTHGSAGSGRCNNRYHTNDKFAVDYPLSEGDRIFSPFKRGKVVFAGRSYAYRAYGNMVVIKANRGKYVSLSAHLSSVATGIKPGKTVYRNTVIGYAGDTGGNIPAGEVHLHQVFYRYPSYNPDGTPYGGAGLKVDRLRYNGGAARRAGIDVSSKVYKLGRVTPDYRRYCREKITCGEGYKISN